MSLTWLKKTFSPCTNIHKVAFSFGQTYEFRNIEYHSSSSVLEESCSGILRYLLNYMIELFNLIKKKYLQNTSKWVIFKNVAKKSLRKTLLRNHFLHSYFPQSLQKNPGQLYSRRVSFYLKWNTLTSGISWKQTHIKLVGIFSHFSVALLLCFHHCNLGEFIWGSSKKLNFIFHDGIFTK